MSFSLTYVSILATQQNLNEISLVSEVFLGGNLTFVPGQKKTDVFALFLAVDEKASENRCDSRKCDCFVGKWGLVDEFSLVSLFWHKHKISVFFRLSSPLFFFYLVGVFFSSFLSSFSFFSPFLFLLFGSQHRRSELPTTPPSSLHEKQVRIFCVVFEALCSSLLFSSVLFFSSSFISISLGFYFVLQPHLR